MLGNVTFYTLHEVAAKFGVSYQMVSKKNCVRLIPYFSVGQKKI